MPSRGRAGHSDRGTQGQCVIEAADADESNPQDFLALENQPEVVL